MADPASAPVAVVGSGAAGLAAAFRLRRAGHPVRLLEHNPRLGGKMLTTRREGFTLEEGPSAMAGSYTSILGIAREAGMAGEITPRPGGSPSPELPTHASGTTWTRRTSCARSCCRRVRSCG